MLQSTINIVKEKKEFTEEELKSMSGEEIANLYMDLMDSAEHLLNDKDVRYCEYLMIKLEDVMDNKDLDL